ncbi:MAG: N-acetylmuramoyl-L-alanine amidase [Dietzia sp.]
MTLDYYQVMPHKITLLGRNFTPGRGGRRPAGLARHHTAGILDSAALNRVWQDRAASTHYLSDPRGIISQHVWDNDQAWANANAWANINLLSIEHSNSTGGPGWSINDATIIGGARWGAALARFYGWGVPRMATNVRDHREFTSTSCPHHIANPHGKYNAGWFEEARWFYDQLANKLVDPRGNPIKRNFPPPAAPAAPTRKGLFMHLSEAEEREILTIARELRNAFLAPVPSTVPGSTYKAPRVAFIDHLDRKVEELHVEYAGKSTPAQVEMDELQAASDAHEVNDEHRHDQEDK